MKIHQLSLGLVAGVLLAGAFSSAALAQSGGPLFADSQEKCASPDIDTEGVAIYPTRIVGHGWSCTSTRGTFGGNGSTAQMSCESEDGSSHEAEFTLIVSSGRVALENEGGGQMPLERCGSAGGSAGSGGSARSSGAGPTTIIEGSPMQLSSKFDSSSRTDSGGRYYHSLSIQVSQGSRVRITASSNDFDTVLYVQGHGVELHNDDEDDDFTTDSAIVFHAPQSGTYEVKVVSFFPGQGGDFKVQASVK